MTWHNKYVVLSPPPPPQKKEKKKGGVITPLRPNNGHLSTIATVHSKGIKLS